MKEDRFAEVFVRAILSKDSQEQTALLDEAYKIALTRYGGESEEKPQQKSIDRDTT